MGGCCNWVVDAWTESTTATRKCDRCIDGRTDIQRHMQLFSTIYWHEEAVERGVNILKCKWEEAQ